MAIDVSGINSQLSQFINSSSKASTDQKEFQSLLSDAINKKDDEKLKKACQDFEGYFLQQIFDEMRKTIPDSGLVEKSEGHDIYNDMLYEEYSKNIAEGQGIGISDMLYKQLSKSIK